LLSENRIWFGRDGDARPRVKNFLSEHEGVRAWWWWPNTEVGHNQEAKKEINTLFGAESFDTPKPERLIHRVLSLSTNPGDIVLDSFAGSGTTGAVAHKMGRSWIMIELGEHCHTHIIPRLQKVIDGEDKGGVTEATNWQGGGGFRYFSLAPSLLEKDRWDNWVVNKDYNARMLAAAICKLEGFSYAPSDTHYWQHGRSTETDFIYVTTQTLNADQLQALSDDVGEDKSLLVCCSAFKGDANRYRNLTLKKIPKMVLTKCEWGHDDYSLNVANLPMAQPSVEASPSTNSNRTGKAKQQTQTALPIFDRVREILESARANVARTVNTAQVMANWLIGREIVEDEQAGKRRAGYGAALLAELAVRLKADFGSGYGVDNLELCRRFYLEYPHLLPALNSDAVRRNLAALVPLAYSTTDITSWQPGLLSQDLSWTHYRRLLRVSRAEARCFYEVEAIRNAWSARELERQISRLPTRWNRTGCNPTTC